MFFACAPMLAVIAVGVIAVRPRSIESSATAQGSCVQGHACVVVRAVGVDGVNRRWRGVEERVVGSLFH